VRRVHVLVRGRVQGVWYRGSAQACALELGLDGSARNLPDGRVELYARGPSDEVEEFLAWCGKGPAGARVEAVEIEELDPGEEEPRGFRILR
jgi:acylphosphatase